MALLAAYGFGAGSGSTIADDSGNGHTLTLGSASWTASGHTGPGITNTAANSTGASTSSMPVVTGTACTLMAWVNPLDLTAGTTHFVCGAIETNGNTDFAIFTQRSAFGTPNVVQGDVRVGGLVAVNGTAALTVGTWAHVALTFDGADMRLYVNGTLEATTANAGSLNNAATFYIAGANPTAELDTDVIVDDVRYYNEVLDAAAIVTAMNTPVGGGSQSASASLTATASATAAAQSTKPATGSLTATAAVTAAGASTKPVGAGTTATAGITAVATGVRPATAAVAGAASLTAAASAMKPADAAVEVAADLTAAAAATKPAAAAVTVLATITADASVGTAPKTADAALTALATVTAGMSVTKSFAASLTGTATIAAAVEIPGGPGFLCQDFAGTATVESYGGTAKVVSYGGTVHVESYGGTAQNCGR